MADSSIEVEGFRILAHDNGDGTYSPAITLTTSPSDPTIEIQGLRCRLHDSGETQVIGGSVNTLYAVVVVAD